MIIIAGSDRASRLDPAAPIAGSRALVQNEGLATVLCTDELDTVPYAEEPTGILNSHNREFVLALSTEVARRAPRSA